MPRSLALTGSTGALGGLVAPALADLRPRLVVRDASRAPALGLDVVVASYDDVAACSAALAGVEVLLMVSGSESADRRRDHRRLVEAAAGAGVRHVVYTSFSGADPQATFTLGRDHADTEAALRGSGMGATLVRDNFYADVLPLFADETGAIRGPAGSGRVSAVARADCADVLAAVLRDLAGGVGDLDATTTWTLTGPQALGLDEVADRAGAALGRDLRYVEESVEEAWASRRAAYPGEPDWQIEAWVSTYTAIADGSCAAITDHVERLAGHPARTIEQALGA